jgi:hypothetical protein
MLPMIRISSRNLKITFRLMTSCKFLIIPLICVSYINRSLPRYTFSLIPIISRAQNCNFLAYYALTIVIKTQVLHTFYTVDLQLYKCCNDPENNYSYYECPSFKFKTWQVLKRFFFTIEERAILTGQHL